MLCVKARLALAASLLASACGAPASIKRCGDAAACMDGGGAKDSKPLSDVAADRTQPVDGPPGQDPDLAPDLPENPPPDTKPDLPPPDVKPDLAPDVKPDLAPDLAPDMANTTLANGTACNNGGQCKSGFCVDSL